MEFACSTPFRPLAAHHLTNEKLQFLLGSSVERLLAELAGVPELKTPVGQCISLDTKNIIAWVKQNNPKAYVYEHFHSPDHDGFAAAPLAVKGGKKKCSFDKEGLPLCAARLYPGLAQHREILAFPQGIGWAGHLDNE